jgi:hypothetical protein
MDGGEDLPIKDRFCRCAVEQILHPPDVRHIHSLLLQSLIEVVALDRVVGIREVRHNEPDRVPHRPEVVKEPEAEEDDFPDVPSRDEGTLQLIDHRVKGEEEALCDDKRDKLDVAAKEGEAPIGDDPVTGLPGFKDEGEEAHE